MRAQWHVIAGCICCIAFGFAPAASAQDPAEAQGAPAVEPAVEPDAVPAAEAEAEAPPDADASLNAEASLDVGAALDAGAVADESATDDDSHLILGLKFGGALPFSDLGLGPIVAIEAGWVFGDTGGQLAALLDVSYMVATAEGDTPDMRVPGGNYSWKLTQKELVVQPTFLFRLTGMGSLVPYVGLGPRIYMLEGVTEGKAGDEQFGETFERSTTVGVGVPIGLEWAMGPGGLLVEILLQWGPLTHTTTGDSNLGSAALWLGYRALL